MNFIFVLLSLMPLKNIPAYDIAISANGLYSAYQLDSFKADKKFKNKNLLIRGYYSRTGIRLASKRTPLTLELSTLPDEENIVIAELKNTLIVNKNKNDSIVLLCKGNGHINNYPLLNNCLVL